jgi:hypothetical protein
VPKVNIQGTASGGELKGTEMKFYNMDGYEKHHNDINYARTTGLTKMFGEFKDGSSGGGKAADANATTTSTQPESAAKSDAGATAAATTAQPAKADDSAANQGNANANTNTAPNTAVASNLRFGCIKLIDFCVLLDRIVH